MWRHLLRGRWFGAVLPGAFFLAGWLHSVAAAEESSAPRAERNWKQEEFSAFGVRLGHAYPAGGMGGNPGFLIGALMMHHWTPRWGIGFEIDYMNFLPERTFQAPPGPYEMVRKDLSMTVTARWSPILYKWASPLFLAGGGLHYWKAEHDHLKANADGSFSKTGLHKGSGYRPAGVAGVGLTGWVVDYFVWELAVRWHILPEPQAFRSEFSSNIGQAFSLGVLLAMEL